MRFYIDFENVGCGGLKGIENLKESDMVVIYYSNNPSLNMDTVEKLVQTKAKIEFQKLSDEIKNMNLKNALDIVILNDISRLISGQYHEWVVIVSNDGGYDATVNSYAVHGKQVKRVASISKAAQTSTPVQPKKNNSKVSKVNEQEIAALFKKELSQFSANKQEIINMIKGAKTRSQINDTLAKKFHNHTGKIMKAIKPYIKQLPGK